MQCHQFYEEYKKPMYGQNEFMIPKAPQSEEWTFEEISDTFMLKGAREMEMLDELPIGRRNEIINGTFKGFDQYGGPRKFLKQLHKLINQPYY